MMDELPPTKICPICGEEKPRRDFRIYDTPIRECRACRHRARARVRSAFIRRSQSMDVKLKARDKRLTEMHRSQDKEAVIRMLRSAFLRVTATTRNRLNTMRKLTPSPHRAKAIQKREDILRRYEAALEKQIEQVNRGWQVRNIQDLVVEESDAG